MRRRLAALCVPVLLAAGCSAAPKGTAPAPQPSSSPQPAVSDGQWQAGTSNPVADPIYPKYGNPGVDVLHYQLDLNWAPDTKTLTGTATIRLRAVQAASKISLDFSDAYTLTATTVDGQASMGTITTGKLEVPAEPTAGKSVTLLVKYRGTPQTVPMPSHRSDSEPLGLTVTQDGSLWTMQEPYGSSTWYPSNDQPSDKALYDIAVTVPVGWSAVASGTPGKVDGTTYRYSSADPVASYLTTLAVGKYKQETATGPDGLPITLWYQPGRDDAMMKVFRKAPDRIAWLEKKFGKYPFPTAGVVIVPSASAMETQQMVTFGALVREPDKRLDADLLHEFAHQWFGDTVTTATWKDLWLNEGFADYAQFLYESERDGVSMTTWEKQARKTDADFRQRLGPPGSPRADSFAEGNVYLCPALMLHQLHKAIGDAKFYGLAKDWVQQNKGTAQDRAAFVKFVNAYTGQDFTNLVNAWLDSPTTPA